jgi:UDP-glucose 4-epimerase
MENYHTFLVTGCAGFIGSNFVDKLLDLGKKVIGIDNLSTGQENFLNNALKIKNFIFIKDDLLNPQCLDEILSKNKVDFVFHFSANADVRFGLNHTWKDIEQNVIVTHNLLEIMRRFDLNNIAFSSTGSVYGVQSHLPIKEEAPFPIQTSLYGSSKVACEGLITSYAEGFNFNVWIFRFVSILGQRYSHGHIFDFYKQLLNNNKELYILGDGTQKKSYLNIKDCIEASICAINNSKKKINIFNFGTDNFIEVNDSIDIICDYLSISPKIIRGNEKQGWIGDNPFIFLDTDKIKRHGWQAKFSIEDSIRSTLDYLIKNQWLLNKRN